MAAILGREAQQVDAVKLGRATGDSVAGIAGEYTRKG